MASVRFLYLPTIGSTFLGIVLFGYGLVAATEPASMSIYSGVVSPSAAQPVIGGSATLPGADVRLVPFPGGVNVETSDGGGAGRVLTYSAAYEGRLDPMGGETRFDEHEDGFVIYQDAVGGWRFFTIDRTGVRTDDGLSRRLRNGLGIYALLFFGAGLFLISLSAWLLGSAARIRRRLHGIRSVEELESPDCIGAIEGTFHGKAYNVSGVENLKVIQLKGECEIRAHLGGGIIRFRLPESGTSAIGVPEDGQPVTLTGVFSKLGTQLRQAAGEWPGDALVLAGNKDKVASDLIQRALRPALFVLVAASVTWIAALISILVHRR